MTRRRMPKTRRVHRRCPRQCKARTKGKARKTLKSSWKWMRKRKKYRRLTP
jgi:hypothetical protein